MFRRVDQRGQGLVEYALILLVIVIIIACVILTGLALFKKLPFGGGLVLWWRNVFGDPIFRLIAGALVVAQGSVLIALGLVAVGNRLVFKLLMSPTAWSLSSISRQSQAFTESAASSMENIHDKLRKMFADDIEKISFYESRLTSGKTKISRNRACLSGCGGCLLSIIGFIAMTPISAFINLAIFDGLLRLFAGYDTPERVLASAGNLAPALAPYLPLPHAIHGVELDARNGLLVIALGLMVFLNWFLRNVSITGWTWPRMSTPWPWVGFGLGLVLGFIFLNGLLLAYALLYQVLELLALIFGRFFWWRGLYLRVRGAMLRRRIAHGGV